MPFFFFYPAGSAVGLGHDSSLVSRLKRGVRDRNVHLFTVNCTCTLRLKLGLLYVKAGWFVMKPIAVGLQQKQSQDHLYFVTPKKKKIKI